MANDVDDVLEDLRLVTALQSIHFYALHVFDLLELDLQERLQVIRLLPKRAWARRTGPAAQPSPGRTPGPHDAGEGRGTAAG